jgi:hypothetical protein
MAAAIDYCIFRGWAVMPLHSVRDGRCTCGRADCGSPGKHPRTQHGLLDASADPDDAWAAWETFSHSNIGIATGTASSLVVLDVDGSDGEASLATLVGAHEPLPATLTATTGRGRHLYFAYSGAEITNSAGRLGAKLDVRGHGGYVVGPPSVHISGRAYQWVDAAAPIAPLPEWLAVLMQKPAAPPIRPIITTDSHASLTRRARVYIAAAESVGEGQRNVACFHLAGGVASLVGENGEVLGELEILDLMTEFNRRTKPPLGERELRAAVHSAMQNGTPREPKLPASRAQSTIKRSLALRGREVSHAR